MIKTHILEKGNNLKKEAGQLVLTRYQLLEDHPQILDLIVTKEYVAPWIQLETNRKVCNGPISNIGVATAFIPLKSQY